MKKKHIKKHQEEAVKLFKVGGGFLRYSEAIRKGIHPRILYELMDLGIIEKLQRGVYALTDLPDIEEPDLVAISKIIPEGVVCLISALYFHRLTVQIPRWIDVAITQKYIPPQIHYPPVKIHWFSNKFYKTGIEKHNFGGAEIKIYSREKSIIDCFRLREKIGIEIALEALKSYLKQENVNLNLLLEFAKESRVIKILEPYLQALTYDQS
jgi:predicted transcriptional regulator of viral defense system